MTVAKLPRINEYQGVAGPMVFPIQFQFLAATDIVVLLRDTAGVETPAAAGTFTISGGDGDTGQVSFGGSTAGYVVSIRGRTEISQKTEYPYGNNFPSASHERAVDRATMIDQEQQDQIDDAKARAFMVPAGETIGDIVIAPDTALTFDGLRRPVARPIGSFPAGPTGPANSTYTTLTELKAAAVTNRSYNFAPGLYDISGFPAGTYFYTDGDFSGAQYAADFASGAKVQLTAVPLSSGALVRQGAETLVMRQAGDGTVAEDLRTAVRRIGLYPEQFGARGDGVTNDWAAITATLAAAVASGSGRVRFTPGRRYKLNAGITIDVAHVSVDGAGATLDFTGMAAGTAITITGTLDPPWRQATSFIRGLEIVGPGKASAVDGLVFRTAIGLAGSSHLKIEHVDLAFFRVGATFGAQSYIINHWGCDIRECAIAVDIPNEANAGEAYSWFGGVLYQNDLVLRASNVTSDTYFYNTSFDYNGSLFDLNGVRVELHGCHVEATDYDSVPIKLRGSGGSLRMIGGYLVLSDPIPNELPAWIESGVGTTAFFSCFMHNTRTSTNNFASYPAGDSVGGTVGLSDGQGYTINNNCVAIWPDRSMLADGSFEGGMIVDDLFIVLDTVPVASRYAGNNLSISVSNAEQAVGGGSLRFNKVNGQFSYAQFALASVRAVLGGHYTVRLKYKKPGNLAGIMYFSLQWVRLENDGNGVPIVKRSQQVDAIPINFTAASVDWTEIVWGSVTNHAPAWASHFIIVVNGDQLSAGDVYFDALSVDRMG